MALTASAPARAVGATTWQSALVPPTIRRPWRVFEEDLEDKLADAASQGGEAAAHVRQRFAAVQARGARAAFLELHEKLQKTYANVSLMELSAYVCWRRAQAGGVEGAGGDDAEAGFENAWDHLDCDDKAEWVPEDFHAALGSDPRWHPLLADGPPACGQASVEGPSGSHSGVATLLADDGASALVKQDAVPPSELTLPPALKLKLGPSGVGAGGAGGGPSVPQAHPAAPAPQPAAAPTPAPGAAPPGGVGGRRGVPKFAARPGAGANREVRSGRRATCSADEEEEEAEGHGSDHDSRASDSRGSHGESDDHDSRASASPPPRCLGRAAAPAAAAAAVPAANRRPRRAALDPTAMPPPCAALRAGCSTAKLAPENLCPEALEACCSVCGRDDATEDNDLGICDRCDKAFHQLCHKPPITAKGFGHPDDQWFCSACTVELAKLRGLSLAEGDFAWVRAHPVAHDWPARVLRLDFASPTDPKPYWAQPYDAVGKSEGAWMAESQVLPWAQGPHFADVRDSRKRLAIRLAEADGATPISSSMPQAPLAPLPALAAAHGAPGKRRAQAPPPTPAPPTGRPRRGAKAPAATPPSMPAAPALEEELSQQVGEMRRLVDAARARQSRLEQQFDVTKGKPRAGGASAGLACR